MSGLIATAPGKSDVRIFDCVDREVPVLLRMFENRLRGYRAIGYARGEAPLGCADANDASLVDCGGETVGADRDADDFA